MHISTRTFVHKHIIYVVVSTLNKSVLTDQYTVSFAADNVPESLRAIHLFLWEHTPSELSPRAFTDQLRKHIASIGYFSVTEEGMQAPLNSTPALDMAAVI